MNLSKTLLRRKILIVALMGLMFSLALILHFTFKNPTQNHSTPLIENAVALPKQKQANHGLPARLKIPGINVNAAVKYVGLTSDKDMDTPKNPDDVGWFEPGQRPGNNGSAVITGHYGWINGRTAVFDNLHKLRKGDKLYIEDKKGTIITFVVRGSRTYGPNEDATNVFRSSDGKAHLNLITCTGVWNKTQKSYSTRFVVFADKDTE